MLNNICKSVPFHNNYDSIYTINFVYETEKQEYTGLRLESVYKIFYVCSGTGIVHTEGREDVLTKGDVFFSFPGFPFAVESKKDFTYMYISFLGTRANKLFDSEKINAKNFIFHNCEKIQKLWKDGIEIHQDFCDIASESIVLYTFSYLGSRNREEKNEGSFAGKAAVMIKKYADDNLFNPTLSLESVSEALHYNKKYISTVFKENLKIGFCEYINSLRIQYACSLMEQGFTSVTDISNMCGYSSAQYFCNVFKKFMGISPSAYKNSAAK